MKPLDQDNSPRGYSWHARRLFGPDVSYDALPPDKQEQVAAARVVYLKANALKSVRARKLIQAQRLRDKADALEAAVLRGESA